MNINHRLAIAVGHHNAGNLVEAENGYRQILSVSPSHAEALHLIGVIAHQRGHHDLAIKYIRQAIASNDSVATYQNNLAEAYRALGRLDEAITCYRHALVLTPGLAEAHSNLGNALRDQGKLNDAISCLEQALVIKPDLAEAHNNLGNALWDQGRFDAAIGCYRQALVLKPDFPEAYYNLGNALRGQDQPDERITCYRQALILKHDYAEAHNNLGVALSDQGQLDEAIGCYRQALALKPDYVEACNNLGSALSNQGKLDESAACYRQVLGLKPASAEAHNNLGVVLSDQGQLDEAIASYGQALSLNPDYAGAYNNLGNALREKGRSDKATVCYRQALAVKPDFAEAISNLGNVLREEGKFDEAMACYRQALALQPHAPPFHLNLGLLLLSAGDLTDGFVEFEWRWKDKTFLKGSAPLIFPQPFWDGSLLNGKTILLYCEQGLGDTIQSIRYAPLVAKRGGRVMVACQPELVRLFGSVTGIVQVVDYRAPLPAFDSHAPLLSLSRIFGTTLETIPSQCPYITLPSNASGLKLPTVPGSTLKVGIVWAGRPINKNDRNRSCPLSYFLEFAALPGIVLYSLQKPPVAEAFGELNVTMPVHDLSGQLNDFADTAAAVCQLDLVITVDSAVAHLAGALARPVWLILPFIGRHWPWITGREDSPWYPTMKLFRQMAPGDWPGVFARVSYELQLLLEGDSRIKKSSLG